MTDTTQEAKYLLNNEVFVEALDSVKRQATNAALACRIEDDEGRRRYLDAVRTVDKVRAHLTALVNATAPDEVDPEDFYKEQARKRFGLFSVASKT